MTVDWKSRRIFRSDIADMYTDLESQWLLIEVIGRDKNGSASEIRLAYFSDDKDEVHEFLMEKEDDWDWKKSYMIVYADPKKECELI